ncbi:SDR family oxidoreductase [Thalassobacillus hwangdonensis]|uniref:SDR family oxidoreductase n=1 Tax=Thalassobacillus hwangdonensis TaxID=546108 RepID=A0ABW3L751_9BACI
MNILLTGATGFVGKRLMRGLLDQGHVIYPIVRSQAKLNHFLDTLAEGETERIHPIQGDLSLPHFGISETKIGQLKNNIDLFYHTAAFLSFKQEDKEKTFNINVDGTKHALELARSLNVQRFFHVSTAYTLGMESYGLETLHDSNRTFVNYYEESKSHAEHLVWSYRESMDVSIFRPAIIIGDSDTGEAETTFALYGLMKAVSLLKKMTEKQRLDAATTIRLYSDAAARTNLVPVNYVVDVLTAGAAHAKKNQIYHIANNETLTNGEIINLIKEVSQMDNLTLTSSETELTRSDELINEPMKVFHSYLNRTITFDDTNTRRLLAKAGLDPLRLNESHYRMMMETYFNQQ